METVARIDTLGCVDLPDGLGWAMAQPQPDTGALFPEERAAMAAEFTATAAAMGFRRVAYCIPCSPSATPCANAPLGKQLNVSAAPPAVCDERCPWYWLWWRCRCHASARLVVVLPNTTNSAQSSQSNLLPYQNNFNKQTQPADPQLYNNGTSDHSANGADYKDQIVQQNLGKTQQ